MKLREYQELGHNFKLLVSYILLWSSILSCCTVAVLNFRYVTVPHSSDYFSFYMFISLLIGALWIMLTIAFGSESASEDADYTTNYALAGVPVIIAIILQLVPICNNPQLQYILLIVNLVVIIVNLVIANTNFYHYSVFKKDLHYPALKKEFRVLLLKAMTDEQITDELETLWRKFCKTNSITVKSPLEKFRIEVTERELAEVEINVEII